MTTMILVRHGQTEWNRAERFRGRADVPLNETGMAQALATGERLAAEWDPVAVYASPLSRTLRTAESIAHQFELVVRPHAALLDIDYGQWQGLTPDEARQRWPEQVHAWYTTPERAHIPGGETLDALRSRAMTAIRELASQHAEDTIVLVAHTAVNRILLLGVLGLSNDRFWKLRQDPCAINVLEADGKDFTLVSLNDTCHLRTLDSNNAVA